MTTITKYLCGLCHAEYDTVEKCLACERMHIQLSKWDSASYKEGMSYPTHVYFETEDHHLVRYAYLQDLGEVPEEDRNDC